MSDPLPLVSVITVTYNSAQHVVAALSSVIAAADEAGVAFDLCIIDNASSDGSPEVVERAFPSASIIRNNENLGFGRASNQGLACARGSRVLLLNPDATLDRRSLTELMSGMSRLNAGAVAPAVGDGPAESAGMAPSIRSAIGHFLFVNRLLPGDRGGPWRGLQLHRRGSRPRFVEWASAAVLLVDAAALREVGGFDERFFLYGEDVDLGLRLRTAGHVLWLVPSARASHLIAASQGGLSTRWVDALHALYARSAGRSRLFIFDATLALGLTIRSGLLRLQSGDAGRPKHRARMRAAAVRARSLARTTLFDRTSGID